MILDDIVFYRKQQLRREKERLSPAEAERAALRGGRTPLDFKAAITKDGINIIAEVKKASPSKGVIAADFHPEETALLYEQSGADAISVLTEEHYFRGCGDYLRNIRAKTSLPLLRKDFIFDDYQIYEAYLLGADAVLLIAALLGAAEMRRLRLLAQSLGMAALCESHNEAELEICAQAGAEIFGINNRNLHTFEVNPETTERLAALLPKGSAVVSESGMLCERDVLRARSSGASAVLIGESLMRSPDLLPRIKEAAK